VGAYDRSDGSPVRPRSHLHRPSRSYRHPLRGSGVALEDVERWLAAWEARAGLSGLDAHDRDFWQAGADWIEAERRTVR